MATHGYVGALQYFFGDVVHVRMVFFIAEQALIAKQADFCSAIFQVLLGYFFLLARL